MSNQKKRVSLRQKRREHVDAENRLQNAVSQVISFAKLIDKLQINVDLSENTQGVILLQRAYGILEKAGIKSLSKHGDVVENPRKFTFKKIE